MFIAVLVLFSFACIAPFVVYYFKARYANWVLALVPAILFGYFLQFLPVVLHNQSILSQTTWFPAAGVQFAFHLDGLSLLFALLITGIGALILLYSGPYLDDIPKLGRFYGLMFMFMGSMLGIVLADNLILLIIFWELTSLSSFLLIGFEHENIQARKAAIQALFVTSLGGLALLAGIILLGLITQTNVIHRILDMNGLIRENALYIPILILMVTGAFAKSAQFPFHFWLPKAMAAPTPVSAYLHSATMVKAGIYLLARFHPVLAQTPIWYFLLTAVGSLTMLYGAIEAFKQTDIKALLAYTTIIALGSMVFLLGSNEESLARAMVAFLLTHAMYKAALFMAAGDIQHRTGKRDLRELHGLYQPMPVTFGIVLIAGATMAGLPPLLGYYVKELVYAANLARPITAQLLTIIVVLANMVLATLSFILVIKPFLGRKQAKIIKEAEPTMWICGLLLALITVIFSSIPNVLYHYLIIPAASTILYFPSHEAHSELMLWPGLTPSFILSLITTGGAIILYIKRHAIQNKLVGLQPYFQYGPALYYLKFMQFIAWYSQWQTRWLQCGILRIYLFIIFWTMAVVLLLALFYPGITWHWQFPHANWVNTFLGILLCLSAFFTVLVRSYLIGLIYLALSGMSMALLFLFNGAPDVAMTQVIIETLIVIIVVLNLYHQPRLPIIVADQFNTWLLKNITALTIGILIMLLFLAIVSQPLDDRLSQFFIQNSVALGHGKNIVNVILVDFRAMDTLGEIMVVAIAAIGILGLIRGKHGE